MNKLNITLPLIAALCAFALALPAEAKAAKRLKPGLYAAGSMEICLDKDGSWSSLNRPWHGKWRAVKDVGFIYGAHGGKNITITVSDVDVKPTYTLLSWGRYTKKAGISVNRPFMSLGSCKYGQEATKQQTEARAIYAGNGPIYPGYYKIGSMDICLYKDGTWDSWELFYGRWGVKNGGAYIYGQRSYDISISITVADLKAEKLTANLVIWEHFFDRDYLTLEAHQRIVRKSGFNCSKG